MEARRFESPIPGYAPKKPSYATVTSPYDGSVVGEVALVDDEGMDRALTVAGEAQGTQPPAYERAAVLNRLSNLITSNAEELALLIAREGGKPLTDARIEVARAANTAKLSAEEATRIHGEEVPMEGTKAALGRLAFTVREPVGVVAAVSAFNHPINLIAHQVAPAVAAGCPILIKPATNTPLSCTRFMDLLYEAGYPDRLALAVPCSHAVSERMVTSDRIAFFSFVGSAEVGWGLRSKVAPGVRCALEHGGAAPVIIDKTANLDRAVTLLIKGGYYHAGQVCVSVQRIFVERSRRDELMERLREGVASLAVGDPTLPETEVGPLIRQTESDRVYRWVNEARAAGAEVVLGGNQLDHQCYEPTILADAPLSTKVMTEEIFGPVVCINEYSALDEAIAMANDVRWSFQAAVFAQDVDVALATARKLDAAAVMINDHTAFRVDWMPFGGRKASGLSLGGIPLAVRDMMQEKLIVVKLNDPIE